MSNLPAIIAEKPDVRLNCDSKNLGPNAAILDRIIHSVMRPKLMNIKGRFLNSVQMAMGKSFILPIIPVGEKKNVD